MPNVRPAVCRQLVMHPSSSCGTIAVDARRGAALLWAKEGVHMAPTMTKPKRAAKTTTTRTATRSAGTPEMAAIKATINGEIVISGDYPWAFGIKLQKAWTTIMAGTTTAKTGRTNKTTVRGSTARTR